MCFTPKISFATAAIEFAVAGYIFFRFSKSIVARFVTLFIFILGFYQFTEFMMCTSGNFMLWGKMGFITYSFLPAVGLHFILSYTNIKCFKKAWNKVLLYLPMIIFIAIAVFDNNFVISGNCSRFFVSVRNYFQNLGENPLATISYVSYYFGYIVAICIVLAYKIFKETNKKLNNIYLVILITTLLAIFPPLILIILFPTLDHQFPSVYCQFALLYSIFAVIGVYMNDKFGR